MPEDGFEYTISDTAEIKMNFSSALAFLKNGNKVAREGWNGKGMFLLLHEPPVAASLLDGKVYENLPYIQMKTADNKLVPWLASQTDILAEDWVIVD